MAFGKKRQQGQQRKNEGGARRFVGREELMKFFAKFANQAEALVLEQAEIEAAIENGTRKDIERPVDDVAFRSRVTQIRAQVGSGLRKNTAEGGVDWFGPFDGWFKQYASESYGPESEFAVAHGADDDWAGRMIYVVLPSQASKHNTLARWAEFAGMPLVETKGGFRPIYEAVIKKMAEGTPKRADFKDAQAHLEARAKTDEEVRYFRKTRKDVEEWLAGKKPDATEPDAVTPSRDPKRELEKSLEDDIARLAEVRKQLTGQTNAGADWAVLSGTMAMMKEVQDRIKIAEERLAEMEGPKPSPADQRIDRAANVLVDDSTKPGEATATMPGAVHTAPAQIEDIHVPETLEEMVALITRLEKEFDAAVAAADKHYTEATALYAEADTIRKENRQKAADMDKRAGAIETQGAKAKQAAEKIKTRLEAAKAKKAELEKAAKAATVTPPQAEPKLKKVRLAGRKPAVEPVVATPSAVTPDGNSPASKIELIKAIKAKKTELGETTVTNFLNRISGGEDLTAVAEEFAAMTS